MNLLQALMSGQDLSASEAKALMKEMRARIQKGEDPEEVLYEEGLEPDYIFSLI